MSPEDEPAFSALSAEVDAYTRYFEPLGLKLVRHPREFFYFEPEGSEGLAETLPRIAIFSYILVDHAANSGLPVEEYLLSQPFLISKLPHFSLDRYVSLLRQVEIEDAQGLRLVLKSMERIGWVKFLGEDEFKLLRPFHRLLDQCLALSEELATATAAAPSREGSPESPTLE